MKTIRSRFRSQRGLSELERAYLLQSFLKSGIARLTALLADPTVTLDEDDLELELSFGPVVDADRQG